MLKIKYVDELPDCCAEGDQTLYVLNQNDGRVDWDATAAVFGCGTPDTNAAYPVPMRLVRAIERVCAAYRTDELEKARRQVVELNRLVSSMLGTGVKALNLLQSMAEHGFEPRIVGDEQGRVAVLVAGQSEPRTDQWFGALSMAVKRCVEELDEEERRLLLAGWKEEDDA